MDEGRKIHSVDPEKEQLRALLQDREAKLRRVCSTMHAIANMLGLYEGDFPLSQIAMNLPLMLEEVKNSKIDLGPEVLEILKEFSAPKP